MKGLNKHNFLIMGGGLFILLLIAYTIIRNNNEGFQTKKSATEKFILSFENNPRMLLQRNNLVNGCPPNTKNMGIQAFRDKDGNKISSCYAKTNAEYFNIISSSRMLERTIPV